MNATIDTALQRPTWSRKLSPYGQPGAENYRHSFLPQVGRGTYAVILANLPGNIDGLAGNAWKRFTSAVRGSRR